MIKLNLGCGRDIKPGWDNIDQTQNPGVDYVMNLDRPGVVFPYYQTDSVDEFLLSHVIEHIHHVLPLMQECYRIAKPNALMTIEVPYGSSDEAFDDPTHVKPYFHGAFMYFGQPAYHKADYGYRGDWYIEEVSIQIKEAAVGNAPNLTIIEMLERERNIAKNMKAKLRAVKPARSVNDPMQQVPLTLIKI